METVLEPHFTANVYGNESEFWYPDGARESINHVCQEICHSFPATLIEPIYCTIRSRASVSLV